MYTYLDCIFACFFLLDWTLMNCIVYSTLVFAGPLADILKSAATLGDKKVLLELDCWFCSCFGLNIIGFCHFNWSCKSDFHAPKKNNCYMYRTFRNIII